METVKELFQSLIDGYKERIKSPLIGSFMISFFFFNWKYFAILFYSDWSMNCRIEWVEEQYDFWFNFGIPFGISLVYILFLPYLNLLFDVILSKYNKVKTNKKNELTIDKLRQKVLEAVEERKIADAKAGTSEIVELKDRIDALQYENSNLTIQIQESQERHNKTLDQFKSRENEYKNEIKALELHSNKNWAKDILSTRKNVTLAEIKEVLKIADSFSTVDKKMFLKFTLDLFHGRSNVNNIEIYEKLKLITVLQSNDEVSIVLTEQGIMLNDYLKNGGDLI